MHRHLTAHSPAPDVTPSAASTNAAAPIADPLLAFSDYIMALSVASGISEGDHNAAMIFRNAACWLGEVAQHYASGDHASGTSRMTFETPAQAIELAWSGIRRAWDGEEVRPVPPLAWDV